MVVEIHEKVNGKDRVTGRKIYIGDKEITLRFTMPMWYRMEEEICILDDLYTMLSSQGRFAVDKLPALVAMMSGDAVTPKEVLRESDPATMKALINEVMATVAKAISMKETKYEDGSVHDETLEEIEKKDPAAD